MGVRRGCFVDIAFRGGVALFWRCYDRRRIF
jgi:hypothetical protein